MSKILLGRGAEVSADWKEEKRVEVNPSWVIQGLVGLIVAISAWAINQTLGGIQDDIQSIQKDQRQAEIARAQLRTDLSSLEIGLRGDRFTRSDWLRESERLERELDDIRKRLRGLEASGSDSE